MPLPRLPALAGLVFLLLGLASWSGATGSPDVRRVVIVAAGAAAASATSPDGSWRTELPWLLPGDQDLAVAPDGRRVAFAISRTGSSEIYVADAATGDLRRITASSGLADETPAWSPDGHRIAWTVRDAEAGDIWVMRADGTRKRRVVGGEPDDVQPAWSHDGRLLAFASDRGGRFDLWTVPAAGGAPALLLDPAGGDARAPSWSPDGDRVAYSRSAGRGSRIWVLDLRSGKTTRLTGGTVADQRPSWSSSGARLAFTRVAHGRSRTWIVTPGSPAYPVPGTDGDLDPDWALATGDLAPGPAQLLPDLDQRAPTGLVVTFVDGAFRLGFTSTVENLGRGPLRIAGWRRSDRPIMRADQIVERRGGTALRLPAVGSLRYERHPPHRHWHFQEFESYELRRASDHTLVGRDRKTGFCLIDRYGLARSRLDGVGPPRFVSDCGALQPRLRRVEQGSSRGYRDRYPAFFHGQDVDLTGVPAGVYVLVHRANPTRRVREQRYANNAASARIRIRWPRGASAAPEVVVVRRCEASEHCPAP